MELLRRPFRNGDPAMPIRHSARTTLQESTAAAEAEWLDDVLIVISELVQNVSQHTTGEGELIISVATGIVLVEVGDTSITVPHTRHPEAHRAGGRGLLLIEAMSRRWGVRTCPAGKVVWVELAAVVDPHHLSAA